MDNFCKKMDISLISIKEAISIIHHNIKILLKTGKLRPICVVGEAGIGKTDISQQIVKQMEEETKEPWGYINFRTAHIEPEDLKGIPKPNDQGKTFEYVIHEELDKMHDKPYGLICLDEVNRCNLSIMNTVMAALDQRGINTFKFNPKWYVMACMNPPNENYLGSDYLNDLAFRRRLKWLAIQPTSDDFIKYATKHRFNASIIDYLKKHPRDIHNLDAAKSGKIYPCPAAWENVSNLLNFEEISDSQLKAEISGEIGKTTANLFMNWMSTASPINPDDLLTFNNKTQRTFKDMIAKNEWLKLNELLENYLIILMQKNEDHDVHANIILTIIGLLPDEKKQMFLSLLTENGSNKEMYAAIITILSKSPVYRALLKELFRFQATRKN